MLTQIAEKYGLYFILILFGLIFRCAMLKYAILDDQLRMKKVIREIIAVVIITILWSKYSSNENQDRRTSFAMIMLFLGYCVYMLMKKIPQCGYTESILLFVNGLWVTALSFLDFPQNIAYAAFMIGISFCIMKFWGEEKKSDFVEILLLCGESILISIYMYCKKISDPIEIAMVVLFVETFVFTLNCFLMLFVVWLCGEDTDDYWHNLMGLE